VPIVYDRDLLPPACTYPHGCAVADADAGTAFVLGWLAAKVRPILLCQSGGKGRLRACV